MKIILENISKCNHLRKIESISTNFLIRVVNVKGVKYNTCNRVLYAIMDKSTTHKKCGIVFKFVSLFFNHVECLGEVLWF